MNKKKYALVAFICVFSFLSNNIFSQQYLKDTSDLKGSVKSLDYKSSQFSNGEETSWEAESSLFNTEGHVIDKKLANSRYGKVYKSFHRDFDDNGTRCLKHYEFLNKDTVEIRDYKFSNGLKPDMMSLYRRGKHHSDYYYVYNEQGLLADEIIVDQRKLDTSHNYFYYDDFGRKTMNKDFDGRTKLLRVWMYNQEGLLIEKKVLDTNWAKIHYYDRDKDGNFIETKVIDHSNNPATGRSFVMRFTYNHNGQELTAMRRDMEGNIKSSFKYWYNEQGDLSKQKGFYINNDNKKQKVKFSYSYVYDENGNWIEQTRKSRHEILGRSVRNIVYYTD